MKLAEYLEQEEWPAADFADAIGVTREAVRLYLAGRRIPRAETMERIAEVTDGKVRANDFYSASAA